MANRPNQNFNVTGTHTFEKRLDYGNTLGAAAGRVAVYLTPAEAQTLKDSGVYSASLENRLDEAAKGYAAPLSGESAFFA
jgi:hypothetical protein